MLLSLISEDFAVEADLVIEPRPNIRITASVIADAPCPTLIID